MKTKLMMNKLVLIKASPTKKSTMLLCTAMLLSACAGNGIVTLESSVEQLQDLNDHDRDGVIEAREKCANTVLGATIDNYGCGVQTTLIEPFKVDVKFPNNSYDIPSAALPKIQKLASFLEENKELKVNVEGHTSKVGSAELNQILSNNRAKAVVNVLIDDFNIASERVSYKGYGFERLADLTNTEAAHATNRRIMAELSKTVHVSDMIWTIYTVDQAQ